MLKKIGAKSLSSIEKVTVKNVMNPILWICGLISFPSIIAIIYSERDVHYAIVFLAIFPPVVASFFYGYFAFTNPDKLQSESFQLKKQAIELIEEKGSFEPINANVLNTISNPDFIDSKDSNKSNIEENTSNEKPE